MTKTRNLADLGGGFIQAGTGAEQRTVENKLQDYVSLKDFIPEGTNTVTANCAPYLQAAVDHCELNGKTLFIPAGAYRITSPIRTGKVAGITIVGEHQYASTILFEGEGGNCFQHDYNPVTVNVSGTTATVTSTYPHGYSSGLVGSGVFGPLYRLPGEFLGPKTITVTGTNTFTFTVPGGTATPAQTGLICPKYYNYFWLENIRIAAYNTNLAGSAIIIALRGDGGPTRLVRLDRVRTGNYGASNAFNERWNNAVTIYQPTNVLMEDCEFFGASNYVADGTRNGVVLEGVSAMNPASAGSLDGAYGIVMQRCYIPYWFQAVNMLSNAQYANNVGEIHGLEGVYLRDVTGLGHRGIVHTSNIASTLRPADSPIGLEFNIDNCSFEVSGSAIIISRVEGLHIRSSVQLLNGGEKGNIDGTGYSPTESGINIDKCSGVDILGASLFVFFTMGSIAPWIGLKKEAIIKFADSSAVVINNCTMSIPETDVDTVLDIDANCDDVKELETTFTRYDNPGTVPFATIAAGSTDCFSATAARLKTDADRRVSCDAIGHIVLNGQALVTTNASSEATISLPTGLFSSVDPYIQVQMSDADTADVLGYHMPVLIQSSVTTSGFSIRYSSTAGMDNKLHRITYTVTGKA